MFAAIPDLIKLDEQADTKIHLTRAEACELRNLRFEINICAAEEGRRAPHDGDESQVEDAGDYQAYLVNPNSQVGHFRLSCDRSRTVQIQPKVGVRNLFALLAASYKRYEKSPFKKKTVAYDVDIADVIEPLVTMFNEHVRALLREGLLKRYVEREGDCAAIKGRIVFAEQIARNLVHGERIFCRFARHETDIPENQVILFTLLLLRRISDLSASVRRELTAHILHFGDVSIRQFLPRQMPQFTYDRLSARYEDVHSWCRLFIDMMSLSNKPGERVFSGFLLDMNLLFERFVISMFERASRSVFGVSPRPDRRRLLTTNTGIEVEPDLLLGRQDGLAIPVDAKYKKTKGPDKAKHPDLYQIVTYCTALGLIGEQRLSWHGMLVYPRSELDAELEANLHIITERGPQSTLTIAVYGLDLSSTSVVSDTQRRFREILEHLKYGTAASVPVAFGLTNDNTTEPRDSSTAKGEMLV